MGPQKNHLFIILLQENYHGVRHIQNGEINFSFVKNEKIVKVEKTHDELYLDDRKLNISKFDLISRKYLGQV